MEEWNDGISAVGIEFNHLTITPVNPIPHIC
jgi:hypothetical protein